MNLVDWSQAVHRVLRYTLLMGSCLPAATHIWAQEGGVVRGVVTDGQTGNPLAGAQVFLENTGRNAETDISGYFLIGEVPSGTHALFARAIGYRTRRIPGITVEAPTGETYAGTTVSVELYTDSYVDGLPVPPSLRSSDGCGNTPWSVLAAADRLLRESDLGVERMLADSITRRYRNSQVCRIMVSRALEYLAEESDLPVLIGDHPGEFRWEDSSWDVFRNGPTGVVHLRWDGRRPASLTHPAYLVIFDLATLRVVGYVSGYPGR